MKKLARHVSLNAIFFGLSFLWNSLHLLILPLILLPFGTETTKNSRLGLLTFVGLVVAMLVQPLVGSWSDRTKHRHGRRAPWIISGVLLALPLIPTIGQAQSLLAVSACYILLQIVGNSAMAPAQGLIPDHVDMGERGTASGIKNLLDFSGVIAASVVMGLLLGGHTPNISTALWVCLGVLAVSGLVNGISAARQAEFVPSSSLAIPKQILDADVKKHYARLMGSRFALLTATYSVQAFGLYYLQDVLHAANPAAEMSTLMAIIGVAIVLVVVPAGTLSQKTGPRRLAMIACAMVSLSLVGLAFAQSVLLVRILGGIVGLAMGAFLSSNWAWATSLTPSETAGRYLGLANIATAGAGATSRLSGLIIDGVNKVQPGKGYMVLFLLGAVSCAVAFGLSKSVKEPGEF